MEIEEEADDGKKSSESTPIICFVCSIVLSSGFVRILLNESRFSNFFSLFCFLLNINAHSVKRKVSKLF